MPNKILFTFTNGPKVEIEGDDPSKVYHVEFIDSATEELVYATDISAGQWSVANPKYYIKWRIKAYENSVVKLDYTMDLENRDVLIVMESKSLGDNIAWTPYAEEFRKKHNCRVHLATFWNNILASEYPDINFITHDTMNQSGVTYYAVYHIGAFDNDYFKNKNNWRLIPLQQISADILGIPYYETRPKVKLGNAPPPIKEPYIAISEFSTWHAKGWHYPNGWQTIVDRLNAFGYKVMSISKEPSNLKNVIKRNNRSIEETINNIRHADGFIGGSCGPVVVAWACGVPVTIISSATEPWSEFAECTRIHNPNFCHGCFNDTTHQIDRANWKYCPRGRSFECTMHTTPDMVWNAILPTLAAQKAVKHHKVLFLTPHCSTGGGPQYLLRCVEELRESGAEVIVVEHTNISDSYVVQKNKIKALVPFHTLNGGDKASELATILLNFKPDVVHLHEFPERYGFLDVPTAAFLYGKPRDWKIVETPHGDGIGPKDKKWWPDAFAFVSRYHQEMFKDSGIPSTVVEYSLPKRQRPDRVTSLERLGLDANQRHILNVGLLAPNKNQGEVFKIAERMPDLQFHFVGNTADNFKSYWEPLLATQPANCTVWGERPDVDSFYCCMDAFLFPSLRELNPLVVKEAIAWGMPVLMRNLSNYCGMYDNEPMITFIDDDVDKTVALLRKMFPLHTDIGPALHELYQQVSAR